MKRKILLVRDVEWKQDLWETILQQEYDVVGVADGGEVLTYLATGGENISAVLLDISMSEMSEHEVVEQMRDRGWLEWIPALIIRAEYSIEAENNLFRMGISDVIHKPFDASTVRLRVKNLVEWYNYRQILQKKVKTQAAKLQENNENIIDILGAVVAFRNLESGEHIRRVKEFTNILAKQVMKQYPEYGLTEKNIHDIVMASTLHDVGKITIPDKILLKPGKLTKEEFESMQSHTLRGCDLLNALGEIWTDDCRRICYEICRSHHERYDGKGYPDRLIGDAIPISAQIVSVADVYDALISERVYKHAYSKEDAYHMIRSGECGMFSPRLMECLCQVRNQFEKLAI